MTVQVFRTKKKRGENYFKINWHTLQCRRILGYRLLLPCCFHKTKIRCELNLKVVLSLVLLKARIFLNCHIFFLFFQQCWWRAVLKRLWFIRLRSATVILQKACRRKLDAKNKSAAKIQALVRGHLARNQLRLVHKSALRIQVGKGSWFSSCNDLPSYLEQAQFEELIEVAVRQINVIFFLSPDFLAWLPSKTRSLLSQGQKSAQAH